MSKPSRLSRRAMLITSSVGLVACSGIARAADLVVTPAQTEGPFYPDKLPLDQDNDLLKVEGATAVAAGTIANIHGRILGPDGKPILGAIVEIWQCDANGIYLHTQGGDRAKRDAGFQGFGRCIVDDEGSYRFRTIKPVSYPGRTPHIHYKIKLGEKDLLTTQCYINGEAMNKRDGVLRHVKDPKALQALMADFIPAAGGEGCSARFDIVLGKTPPQS